MNKISKEIMLIAKEMKNIFGDEIEVGEIYQKKSGNRTLICYPKLYEFNISVLTGEIMLDTVNKLSESLEKEIKYEIEDCECTASSLNGFVVPVSQSEFKIMVVGHINEGITEKTLLKNGYKRIK